MAGGNSNAKMGLIGTIIAAATTIATGIAGGVQGRRLGRESKEASEQYRGDELTALETKTRLSEEGLDLQRSQIAEQKRVNSFNMGEASANRLQQHAEYINSILNKEPEMKNNLINILNKRQGGNYALRS